MNTQKSGGQITLFNPWWGCAKVSPGCVNCYAESLSKRYGNDVWGKGGSRRFFGDKHWEEPLKWNRKAEAEGIRRRVFCGSMMDVFEPREDLRAPRRRLFSLINETPQLDWLLLTKRPEEVDVVTPLGEDWPLNVWLGTSVEDQRRADERIPRLLEIPAAVRFLSCEPLLGPVDVRAHLADVAEPPEYGEKWAYACQAHGFEECAQDPSCPGLDWVIVGGESGPKARPMNPDWARTLKTQCQAAEVAFFGKQGSGLYSERQYNLPDEVWNTKQWPKSPASLVPEGRLL